MEELVEPAQGDNEDCLVAASPFLLDKDIKYAAP